MVGTWWLHLQLRMHIGLQSLERYHYNRDIVQSLFIESKLHYVFHCFTAKLMKIAECSLVSFEGVPDHLDYFSIAKFVVDAVT